MKYHVAVALFRTSKRAGDWSRRDLCRPMSQTKNSRSTKRRIFVKNSEKVLLSEHMLSDCLSLEKLSYWKNSQYYNRVTKESIELWKSPFTVNGDNGLDIYNIRLPIATTRGRKGTNGRKQPAGKWNGNTKIYQNQCLSSSKPYTNIHTQKYTQKLTEYKQTQFTFRYVLVAIHYIPWRNLTTW